ncbi:MAG: shikimate kinase [Candidatus Thermoplasmatota archaeon]
MIGRAACRGAATIVNAIPTGRGAAFGITLETDAEVRLLAEGEAFKFAGPPEGADLVRRCVAPVLREAGLGGRGAEVRVESDIPVSRGLKSSSAASNAVVLAATRAVKSRLDDMRIIGAGVDASIGAGVTVTGAFDDAAACYLGGAVVTDNRHRRVLARGRIDPSLSVLIHVPDRRVEKAFVKGLDFSPAVPGSEEALELALSGSYARAIEVNSRACAEVLGLSEEVAQMARDKGAVAAGISGTGPATVILARREDEARLGAALEGRADGIILRASINDTPAPEVVPRLL